MSAKLARSAQADVEAIFHTIAMNNPGAALRFLDQVDATLERLGRFPDMGHEGRVARTREVAMTRYPYRIVYQLLGKQVVVIRVVHGAMRWPPEDE